MACITSCSLDHQFRCTLYTIKHSKFIYYNLIPYLSKMISYSPLYFFLNRQTIFPKELHCVYHCIFSASSSRKCSPNHNNTNLCEQLIAQKMKTSHIFRVLQLLPHFPLRRHSNETPIILPKVDETSALYLAYQQYLLSLLPSDALQ